MLRIDVHRRHGRDPGIYREAARRLRIAAEAGHALGQNDLGYMYQNGMGVERDYAEAVKWYRLAADGGNSIAEANLAFMYLGGLGVAKDQDEAIKVVSQSRGPWQPKRHADS